MLACLELRCMLHLRCCLAARSNCIIIIILHVCFSLSPTMKSPACPRAVGRSSSRTWARHRGSERARAQAAKAPRGGEDLPEVDLPVAKPYRNPVRRSFNLPLASEQARLSLSHIAITLDNESGDHARGRICHGCDRLWRSLPKSMCRSQ